MPEPLSTTIGICWLGYTAAQGFAHRSGAVSPEAQVVRKAVTEVIALGEQSQALFGAKAAALSHLRALANDSAEPGWDGYDSEPINAMAVSMAENLIRALPDSVPLPEFAAEPDGCVSLDWIDARHRLLTLTIGSGDRLAYAWIDGSDKGHAVARFDGKQVPHLILEAIKGIFNHGHARLRAA